MNNLTQKDTLYLRDSMPTMQAKKLTPYQKNWLSVTKEFARILEKIKFRQGKREKIIIEAEELIRKAKFFEFNDYVLILITNLSKYLQFEGASNNDLKKAKKYRREIDHYSKVVSSELSIEKRIIDINFLITRKASDNTLLKNIYTYLEEIESTKTDSYNFKLYHFEILLKKYILEDSNEKILFICNEALNYFAQKRYKVSSIITIAFSLPKIPVFIERGQIERAQTIIENCYPVLDKYINNWYAVHSYDVILNFYLLDFDKVDLLLKQAKKFPNQIIKERYILFSAYLALFQDNKTRINKLINQIPIHSKDKRGYNIAIIIVKLLILAKQKRYDEYIDLIEKTKQYIKEWINQKRTLRSKYFLQALLTLPKSDFYLMRYKLNARRYLKELEKLPIKCNSPSVEIEMIPYEYLNEVLKGLLK